ncbi:hypothetical protein BGZ72_004000 [Mortierella alpina]|nr:hypothetical protein BGZ72_004000 [Mortierella alpina]
MTSTASAWSRFTTSVPDRTDYTEEAIENAMLTADQVIDKAQSSATLLVEMVAAFEQESQSLRALESNDLLQTLQVECQEMAEFLHKRIWDDSGDQDYYAYDSSSSRSHQKTADEEAQTAAFIVCSEYIQSALQRYAELKDHLQAVKLQEEEDRTPIFRNSAVTTNDIHAKLFEYDDLEDEDALLDGISIEGHNAQQHHLRKSQQPLVWQLDPREDFKANKTKNKKWIDKAEKSRLEKERMLERSPRNGIHGLLPEPEIALEMLVVDEVDEDKQQEDKEVEGTQNASHGTSTAQVEVDEDGLERIINRLEDVADVDEKEKEEEEKEEKQKEDEDKDDQGMLSDDSWEEIPEQALVGLSIEDEGVQTTSTTSSSTSSSILITKANSVPSLPSTPMREL